MAKTVTLTKVDYDNMKSRIKELEEEVKEGNEAQKKLEALEAHGVDNWQGYGYAMAEYQDDDS